jgi:hypothetical protein
VKEEEATRKCINEGRKEGRKEDMIYRKGMKNVKEGR